MIANRGNRLTIGVASRHSQNTPAPLSLMNAMLKIDLSRHHLEQKINNWFPMFLWSHTQNNDHFSCYSMQKKISMSAIFTYQLSYGFFGNTLSTSSWDGCLHLDPQTLLLRDTLDCCWCCCSSSYLIRLYQLNIKYQHGMPNTPTCVPKV